jgi:Na+-driven multidrug efflux pump
VTNAGMKANLTMTGVLAVLLVVASHPLLALFLGGNSPALPIAQHMQYVVTWSFVVMGASMIVGGTMRSYGVVWWPLFLQFLAFYPVRLGFYFTTYQWLASRPASRWCAPGCSTRAAHGARSATKPTRGRRSGP